MWLALLTFSISDNRSYIVQPFADGGKLYDELENRKQGYTEDDVRDYVKTILEVLATIHEKRIVHRDLKPHNILLASEQNYGEEKKFRLLLSNFWFARYVPPVETVNSNRGSGAGHSYGEGGCLTKCGCIEFMAPEMNQLIPYGTSVDMWSAGCLFYMLIAGSIPFMQSDLSENTRTIFIWCIYFR
jgi:calcium/calmodulin-dependent protein kinase I